MSPAFRFPLLRYCLLGLTLLYGSVASADVVKPALIEISAYKTGELEIELRASIEALLTGINAAYKNTQDAPNADEYDALRILEAEALAVEFDRFESEYLSAIALHADTDDGKLSIPLEVRQVDIPEPGYTKVPRISTLWLTGRLPQNATTLSLSYPVRFSDSSTRPVRSPL